jgi:hypothetical protein
MSKWYKLDEKNNPVRCVDHSEYFNWHKSLPVDGKTGIGIQVASTKVSDGVCVSTVFLGSDHGWGDGPPVLWETMIFGGDRNEDCERYCSLKESLDGHNKIVSDLLNQKKVSNEQQ